MRLRIIIVDDERIARQRLRRLLVADPKTEVIAECANGVEAMTAIKEHSPDLVLLDIQMPGISGFDVADKINGQIKPIVVFVTAFDEHAVRAFETCALDYLVKPVAPERLSKTLARVRDRLKQKGKQVNLALQKDKDRNRRFLVRSGLETSLVAPNDIDWIEACGNYAILHVGNRKHFLRATMSALETQLPSDDFLRVSRSAILHLDRVKEIHTAGGGHHSVLLKDGQLINFTRSVREVASRLRSR